MVGRFPWPNFIPHCRRHAPYFRTPPYEAPGECLVDFMYLAKLQLGGALRDFSLVLFVLMLAVYGIWEGLAA